MTYACGRCDTDGYGARPCPSDPKFPKLEEYELRFKEHDSEPTWKWSCFAIGKTQMAQQATEYRPICPARPMGGSSKAPLNDLRSAPRRRKLPRFCDLADVRETYILPTAFNPSNVGGIDRRLTDAFTLTNRCALLLPLRPWRPRWEIGSILPAIRGTQDGNLGERSLR